MKKIFTALEDNEIKRKNTPFSLMMEDFEKRGIMNDADVDYLDHLDIPVPDANDVALEGVVKAQAKDVVGIYTSAYREAKGWFLGMEAKRKYIEEVCIGTIDWLKDKDMNYKNLDLDMGTFKTWLKTSEFFGWRYYFLLDDSTWRNIEEDLRSGNVTALETIYSVDFKSRRNTARQLDSISDIDGLIKVVELYIKRSNIFFDLIVKRKVKIKSAPFQVILLGAIDLRKTAKKIVNLAL